MAEPYEIEFTRPAHAHLRALQRYERNVILDAIKEHLHFTPAEETGKKKLLRPNPLADFELRIGNFRVFYDVDGAVRCVRILAIGIKNREKLMVGGREITI